MVTHFNHAGEVTAESGRVAGLFAKAAIPLLNQAVLLRGVNDQVHAQLNLWRAMVRLSIKPYYLHHPDRAPGNASFRLTIRQGLAIFGGFRRQWEGPAPEYVLDLPDGRGKVPISALRNDAPGVYVYEHGDGHRSTYRELDVGAAVLAK